MNWVRSNIKWGARLALLALAIQFVLSFGHIHGDVAHAAPAMQSVAIDHSVPNSGDRDHDQGGHACVICAVMSLAQLALTATPPVLLLPQAIDLLQRTTTAEFAHLEILRSAFQPRAPPAS